MSLPVVVSRIQNRRGTQQNFLNLYPPGYDGIQGYTFGALGFQPPLTPVLGASGNGTSVTLTFASSPVANYPVGSQIIVAGITPITFNGIYTVTATSPTSVSYASVVTDIYISGGAITFPYNSTNYPTALAPGELALVTDPPGTVYIGNVNGTYAEVGVQSTTPSNITLQPLPIILEPVAVYTPIPQLTYAGVPFMSILFDITDVGTLNWNTVGTSFSRNGELQITALHSSPSPTAALTEISTEINNNPLGQDITFQASFDGVSVTISYVSTFLIPLTFSTSTISWSPF